MPININNNGLKNTNIDTKTNRQVDAGSTAGNSPAPAKSGGGDSVSLTSEAQQLSRLQEKAMGSRPFTRKSNGQQRHRSSQS